VDEIRPGLFDRADLLFEPAEISGQYRWRDFDFHGSVSPSLKKVSTTVFTRPVKSMENLEQSAASSNISSTMPFKMHSSSQYPSFDHAQGSDESQVH
jgi:hypothetical protein